MTTKGEHSALFSELLLRKLRLPNRIVVSPMCQYSARDGYANDWHFVHLASRAVGGAGLVMTEGTAIAQNGRITPHDLGIWSDDHVEGLRRISTFVREQGGAPSMQLAHAGRKASVAPPSEKPRVLEPGEGGWLDVVAPSAIAATGHHAMPQALTLEGIAKIQQEFVSAALRAYEAGFLSIELHAAHGYLIHQFLSPLSNQRADRYGGGFENRCRFLLETVRLVRHAWPSSLPLFVRLSATDWLEYEVGLEGDQKGWKVEDTVELARLLRADGVDLIDVTSGGNDANVKIPTGPGYQLSFTERVRREADIPVAAVGQIVSPEQADSVVRSGQADLVMLAREMLRDPYWPLRAAEKLGHEVTWPVQYVRAAGGRRPPRRALVVEE